MTIIGIHDMVLSRLQDEHWLLDKRQQSAGCVREQKTLFQRFSRDLTIAYFRHPRLGDIRSNSRNGILPVGVIKRCDDLGPIETGRSIDADDAMYFTWHPRSEVER